MVVRRGKHLVIRFERCGHKQHPIYRMVVGFNCNKVLKAIMKLGIYNPYRLGHIFELDCYNLFAWVDKGARVNTTLKKYIVKFLFIVL